MSDKRVLILMGSDSDLPVMQRTADTLTRLGVSYDMHIASAHRTPDKAAGLARAAAGRGVGVIVAGAGMAAHLAGTLAAQTTLPVIGVPMASGPLQGVDALLSTVQMPPGIPVATVGIGPAGATNAGLLAAAILALGNAELAARLESERERQVQAVEDQDRALQQRT